MELHTFTVGPFAENTYLLTKQRKSILIDPGFFDPGEFAQCKKALEESGSELMAVCLTHAHVDHILGLDRVLKEFDVPVYLNHSDLYLWNHFPEQAAMFGFRAAGSFDLMPEPLPEQEAFTIGPFSFNVLYSPGHSPDHVSLWFPDNDLVIAGDVLFYESVGRTDLYKGDFDLLARTIREKLYPLPDRTTIYPGHGPSTTIGHEKKANGFVRA